MKTNITKGLFLTLIAAISLASCKKDKKDNPPPTPPTVQAITITDLKALGTSASVTVPDNRKIGGTVISDVSNKNIDSKTVVLQQATGQPGIVVTFDAAQTFALGDSLEVVVSKQTLAQVNGEAVLQNVPAANAKKVGTGNVKARTTNAAAIKQNAAAWDGTLVTIPATGLDGGNGKYTGTLTVTDATGSLNSDILAGAVFENTVYPVSLTTLTGIVRVNGTTISIDIRKPADAVLGAVTRVLTENFENVIDLNTAQAPQPNIELSNGMTTSLGEWDPQQSGKWWFLPGGSQYDSFLPAGKNYFYIGGASPLSVLDGSGNAANGTVMIANAFGSLKTFVGLKQVSVTFAGSNLSGTDVLTWDNGVNKFSVAPFNSSTDYFQIAIDPNAQINALVSTSDKYTSTGVFHTFTWTVPTKEQLVAGGMTSADADAWLASPRIQISNVSTRAKDPNAGNNNVPAYAPIVIQKIEFGF